VLHDSANSFIVRPAENDLKSNGFLDNYSMKAKSGHFIEEMAVIKMFSCNYARSNTIYLLVLFFFNLLYHI
jgi:hypothetical protein